MKTGEKVGLLGLAVLAAVLLWKKVAKTDIPPTETPPIEKTMVLPGQSQLYKTEAVFDMGAIYQCSKATVVYTVGWKTNYTGVVTIAVSTDGASYTPVGTVDGLGHVQLQADVDINAAIRYIKVTTTAPPYLDYAQVTVTHTGIYTGQD